MSNVNDGDDHDGDEDDDDDDSSSLPYRNHHDCSEHCSTAYTEHCTTHCTHYTVHSVGVQYIQSMKFHILYVATCYMLLRHPINVVAQTLNNNNNNNDDGSNDNAVVERSNSPKCRRSNL